MAKTKTSLINKILPSDSKSRGLIIIGLGIVVIVVLFFVFTADSGSSDAQKSSTARVPRGIDNLVGGKLTDEYRKALVKSNEAELRSAQMSGQSSVAVMLNTNFDEEAGVQCSQSCEDISVDDAVRSLLMSGKIDPDTADALINMSNANVSVSEYAADLDRLVREGKLTPEQARLLLKQYKKQHDKISVAQGAAMMDDLIKSGELPLDVADDLLAMQNDDVSVEDYAAELQRLVREGKISPEAAAKLLAQYKAAKVEKAKKESQAQMNSLVASGDISQADADALVAMQDQEVSVDDYAAELARLVREGKISPETAAKLLAQYKERHAATVTSVEAEKEKAKQQLSDLVSSGAISAEDATALLAMQDSNASVEDYAAELERLVREGKISPETAAKLLAQYRKVHGDEAGIQAQEKLDSLARAAAEGLAEANLPAEDTARLLAMQNNDVSPEDYAAELDRLVREGKLTPEMRDKLLARYTELHKQRSSIITQMSLASMVEVGLPTLEALSANRGATLPSGVVVEEDPEAGLTGFARLKARMERQRAEKAAPAPTKTASKPAQFDSQGVIQNTQPANQQAVIDQAAQDAYYRAQQAAEERRQKLAAVQSAMQGQAQQIYGSWNAMPTQEQLIGIVETEVPGEGVDGEMAGADDVDTGPLLPPVLRAGDILYAVLDTEVNSDYSDQAVMATIVHGKFKGARVLGTLAVGGPDGDALLLRFSSMSKQVWPASLSISALGVNPDTAQQGMASSVDHHYLQRWGTLFATSFLSGYADAVSSAGTATISEGGSSVAVTQAPVSPAGRIMVGLGEVGKAASSEAQAYMNRPPTVILNAGVPVALLLTADVAQPTTFSIDGDAPITVKEVLSTAPKNINAVREELNQ